MKTSLYRYFDMENRLLYVGISKNPITRLKQHGIGKDLTEIRWVELEWFDSRPEASLAEKAAVHRERPIWNIAMQIAARTPRETALPIAGFKPVEPEPATPPQKPQRFGPPVPYYLYAHKVVSDLPRLSEMFQTDKHKLDHVINRFSRRGDVIILGKGVDLPSDASEVERYFIREGEVARIESAQRASKERAIRWKAIKYIGHAKRTMPKGWDGILVDADGRPVHPEGS